MPFCRVCFDPVKNTEKAVVLQTSTLHEKCAKCKECSCTLDASNFVKIIEKQLFCKQHYVEKFARKGIVLLQARARTFLMLQRKPLLFRKLLIQRIIVIAAVKIQATYRGHRSREKWKFLKLRNWRKLSYEIEKCRLRPFKPKNQDINDMTFNVYSDFPEFSRKQLDKYIELFNTYDMDGNGKITVEGLKKMMEKLGVPQTHLQLKALIQEVDDDRDGLINLKDFITLFRRRNKGELLPNSSSAALVNIFDRTVNVREVGVEGAKAFFEGKSKLNVASDLAKKEVIELNEENKIKKAEKAKRKEEFQNRRASYIKGSGSGSTTTGGGGGGGNSTPTY